MKPADWTNGKWPQIVAALVGSEFTDKRHHPCPKGDGKDRFRFSDCNGQGNYFCQCSDGDSDGFDLIQCVHNTDFAGACKLIEGVIGKREDDGYKPKDDYAQRLFNDAIDSTRSRYLNSRGLIVPPGIRFHKSIPYFNADGERVANYAAMVAPVTKDGKFVTCHVTYLDNGRKANVDPCRKIMPGPSSRGGAVELWPADKALGIAEGIETAIAATMLHGVRCWAALNTSLLKSWKPPEGVEKVTIFGDKDPNFAGHAAAYQLAHRLHGTVEIELMFPDQVGDFNDELLRQNRRSA